MPFILITFFLLLTSSFEEIIPPCTNELMLYQITPCDKNNNQNVLINQSTRCDATNYTFPKSQIGINCKLCEPGFYLKYNFISKETICSPCPENFYSTGSTFRINGKYFEWTQENLNKFSNECFVVDSKNFENTFCSSFIVSDDNQKLMTGNPNIKEYIGKLYVSQLSISLNLIKKGYIKFKYKKDSIRENGKINGNFRFFLNYLIELNDNSINDNQESEWKEIHYILEPGHYSFLFQYLKNLYSIQSESLDLTLEYIEIDGIQFHSLKCQPCLKGKSEIGKDHCDRCEKNQYFDMTKKTCNNCPKGTIGTLNGKGIESCKPLPNCTKENYYRVISNKCSRATNKQEVTYQLINQDCIETSPIPNEYIPCEKCPKGKYWKDLNTDLKEYICEYCPFGTFSPEEDQDKCIKCEGVSNTIAYYKLDDQKSFSKEIEIIYPESELKIKYSPIDKSVNSSLIAIIDQSSVSYQKTQTEIIINLSKGKHSIKLNSINMIIDLISITNDKNGGSISCKKCPKDSLVLVDNKVYACKECDPGFQYFSNTKICEKCPENYIKPKSGNHEHCQPCPMFTMANEERTQCIPLSILSHNKYMIKINLDLVKSYLGSICKMSDNLCYKELYGPIRDTNKNLYFISFSQAIIFKSVDFSYSLYNNEYQYPSFVYMLEQNKAIDTGKILKSLGKTIEYTKIVKGIKYRGVIIKYANGDIDEKTNTPYNSYLFLNCSKGQNDVTSHTSPKFIKKEKNNIYFEWNNKGACPICLSNEALKFELPCKEGQRVVYYEETPQCLIYNTTGLKGNQIEYLEDDLLLSSETDKEIAEIYNLTDDLLSVKKMDLEYDENNLTFFIFDKKGTENCTLIDDYDNTVKYIIIIIPVLYMIFVILCIYCYCKYRKISGDYQKLFEEPSSNEGVSQHQQIELESSNRANDNGNIEISP